MSVTGDDRAISKALAHHQVSGRDHAVGARHIFRHRMAFYLQSELFQQLGGTPGVSIAVAGRVVGRHLDELCQKGRLGRLTLTYEACNGVAGSVAHLLYSFGMQASHQLAAFALKLRKTLRKMRAPRSASSTVMVSAG